MTENFQVSHIMWIRAKGNTVFSKYFLDFKDIYLINSSVDEGFEVSFFIKYFQPRGICYYCIQAAVDQKLIDLFLSVSDLKGLTESLKHHYFTKLLLKYRRSRKVKEKYKESRKTVQKNEGEKSQRKG